MFPVCRKQPHSVLSFIFVYADLFIFEFARANNKRLFSTICPYNINLNLFSGCRIAPPPLSDSAQFKGQIFSISKQIRLTHLLKNRAPYNRSVAISRFFIRPFNPSGNDCRDILRHKTMPESEKLVFQ